VMGTMVITQALRSRTRGAIAVAVSLLHQSLPSRRAHRPRWVGPTTSSGRTTRPSGVSTGCPAFSRPYSGPFGTPNATLAPRVVPQGFLRELVPLLEHKKSGTECSAKKTHNLRGTPIAPTEPSCGHSYNQTMDYQTATKTSKAAGAGLPKPLSLERGDSLGVEGCGSH